MMDFLLRVLIVVLLSGCSNTKTLTYVNEINLNSRKPSKQEQLKITFLGNTSIYFEDIAQAKEPHNKESGSSSILIDGFVSRPSLLSLMFSKLDHNDGKQVDKVLSAAEISNVGYVIPLHAHFDHFLDAPYISSSRNATLIASKTMQYIGNQMIFDKPIKFKTYTFSEGEQAVPNRQINGSAFELVVEKAVHNDTGLIGKLFAPLDEKYPPEQPVNFSTKQTASKYVEGESVNIFIKHKPSDTRIYILGGMPDGYTNPSIEKMPKSLETADIVFLGLPVVKLQLRDEIKRTKFWEDLFSNRSRKVIIPMHWDTFYRKIDRNNCIDENLDNCLKPLLTMKSTMQEVNEELTKIKAKGYPVDIFWLTSFGRINITSENAH